MILSAVLFKGTILVTGTGYQLELKIDQVYVDKVKIVSCSFGSLSAFTLKIELNNGFRLFLPIINKELVGYTLTVPNNIFGLFLLSDLTISYYNNYIYLGMTPTFLAPASAVQKFL